MKACVERPKCRSIICDYFILQYVIMCLEMTLYILLNCAHTKSVLPAFEFADSVTLLIPLANCTHLSIRVKAKSILSFLQCYMSEGDLEILKIDSEELAFLLENSDLAAAEPGSTDSIDAEYWLQILKNLSRLKENHGQLCTKKVFQVISDYLTWEGKIESAQELILQVLWYLVQSSENAMGMISDQFLEALENFLSHTNINLQCLSFCVLWHLGKTKSSGELFILEIMYSNN